MLYGYLDLVNQKIDFTETWIEYLKIKNNTTFVKSFINLQEFLHWKKLIIQKITFNWKIFPNKYLYCDAGTAFGNVEIRITNEKGESLLNNIINEKFLNIRKNFVFSKEYTNNFGELMSNYLTMKLIINNSDKYINFNIAGDSAIVIFFWLIIENKKKFSNNIYTNFLHSAYKLYIEFKKLGHEIEYIPRNLNPADLRFNIHTKD
jgi:hypothetical protein